MSFFPSPTQFFTGVIRLLNPYVLTVSTDAPLTSARQLPPTAPPNAPNIGRMYTGCGVGIDAFGSPICAHAINPPFNPSSGLIPKNAGFHKTKSANFPTSTDPTIWP